MPGSLSGAGAAVNYNINVTNSAYPISVTMVMSTWSSVDFDVYLFNPSGTRMALSEGTTRQETIGYRHPATGTYLLEVRSYSGSGSYFAVA